MSSKNAYEEKGIGASIFEQLIHGTTLDANGDPVAQYHLELQYEYASTYLETIANTKLPFLNNALTGRAQLLFRAANSIHQYITQQFQTTDELKKFAVYVLYHVRFVQIETHDMSDALKIFETINQRGIGLTPMDLLKNMIFRQVPRSKFSDLNAQWKRIMELLQDGKVKELPLCFLRYYLMATYDTTDLRDGILREDSIYNWLNAHPDKCNYQKDPFGFVNSMKAGAERYMKYLEGGGSEPGDNHIKNITQLGGSAYKLHLLLLLAARNMGSKALTRLKELLESIVYYTIVNQVKTNEVERMYALWCPKIRKIKTEDDLTTFIQTDVIPATNQRKVNNKANFMLLGFGYMQQYRIKFILARITKYVETKRKNGGDATCVDEFYDGGVEIEHILPQTITGGVPPFGLTQAEYDVIKQRLGNLTLLEKTINASIQNDDYASNSAAYLQSAYYLTHSIAQLDDLGQNTAINKMNQRLKAWADWNEKTITERQEILYFLSEDIWTIQ